MSTHAFERHTHEVRVHLEGESFDHLFLEGARAIAELVGTPSQDPPGPWQHVSVEAQDRSRLLVVWLNELISRSDVDHLIYADAEIDELTANRIDARIRGVPIGQVGVGLGVATSHALELAPVGETLSATITVETRG
ncbi:MAG TPA: archease [Kofleriaceae bacterium]|nr:archease [Kofleriaceae bacterium]